MSSIIKSEIKLIFINDKIKTSINSISLKMDGIANIYYVNNKNNEIIITHVSNDKDTFEEIDFKNNEKELIEYTKKYLVKEIEKIGKFIIETEKVFLKYDLE
jgi:hypothetical protein